MISFVVRGRPATQGSKISHPLRTKHGHMIHVTRDTCKRLPKWRRRVASAARNAYSGEPMDGAFTLAITFYLRRPKSHYGTGQNERALKPQAPPKPITRPDTLKMARAVEDSLSGVIYNDDSQVTHLALWKEYVNHWEDECVAVDVTKTETEN